MLALLCSVQTEAEQLRAAIAVTNTATIGSTTIIEGSLSGRPVLLCAGGMGKVNAAHAATLMLTKYPVEALFIFGIGGAYSSSGAKVGDVALAKVEIAGDEGVLTNDGYRDASYIGIPLVQSTPPVYSTFAAPESLLQHSLSALASSWKTGASKLHVGPFVTLSTSSGTTARALDLEDRYHGLCENMEGAAAAQIAVLHGIPWLEARGISNIVEERDLKKWDIPRAAAAAQDAVRLIVEEGGR